MSNLDIFMRGGAALHTDWKKQFAVIYAGQAFSLLGSAAVQFAVIWWLTVQMESAVTLALATAASFLPNIVLGPFAGVWIDRYNRKKVMIAADGAVALSSVILGIAFLCMEVPPVWFIYIVLFMRGIGNTLHSPAMQAAIPMLVPVEMLTKAGGWGNLIVSVSTMLGPALGAGLMGVFPIAVIMLIDIMGALIAILCLSMVRIPDLPRRAEKVRMLQDIKNGFTAISRNKPLITVFFPIIFASILYMPMGTLFPLLVRVHYMGGAWHNAAVEFVFSGGLLVSSFIIGVWGNSKRRFVMISSSMIVLGVAAVISGGLPPEGFWGFVICCFFMGASGTLFHVPLMAYIQETIPPEMMGKVFSLFTMAMILATPLGLLAAGPVSEAVGVHRWFLWSGLLMGVTGIICMFMTHSFDKPIGS